MYVFIFSCVPELQSQLSKACQQSWFDSIMQLETFPTLALLRFPEESIAPSLASLSQVHPSLSNIPLFWLSFAALLCSAL